MLIDLRDHVRGGLDEHSRDSLKTSAREDSGDIADSDANSDAFDRDCALSLVANEQEAIAEIDAAIQRMVDGNYGVCEITGKQISAERLEGRALHPLLARRAGRVRAPEPAPHPAQRQLLDSAEDVNAFGGEDAEE
jgi:RNA polymerase-binding transcription factor DksA